MSQPTIVTKENAGKMVCPFQMANGRFSGCRTTACMAWVTTGYTQHVDGTIVEKGADGLYREVVKVIDKPKGYCGMVNHA